MTPEKRGDRAARGRVSDVFEAVHLDSVLTVLLTGSELTDRLLELRHRLRQEVSQLTRRSGYDHDLVKVHRVCDLFDVIEDVVKTGRKGGDVLVVEGGDKGLVEGAHGFISVFISQALEVLDLPLSGREVPHVAESLLEEDARADEYRSLLFEEVVEALLSGDER